MTHTAAWLDPLFLSPVVALSFPLPEVDIVTNSLGATRQINCFDYFHSASNNPKKRIQGNRRRWRAQAWL